MILLQTLLIAIAMIVVASAAVLSYLVVFTLGVVTATADAWQLAEGVRMAGANLHWLQVNAEERDSVFLDGRDCL